MYVSFYVEAVNRDAFMSIKQDLLLAFIDCVDRNGAKLAKQRLEVSMTHMSKPLWAFPAPVPPKKECCLDTQESSKWWWTVQVEVAPSQLGAASSQRPAPSGASDASASSQKALPEGKAGAQQAPVDVAAGNPPSSGGVP